MHGDDISLALSTVFAGLLGGNLALALGNHSLLLLDVLLHLLDLPLRALVSTAAWGASGSLTSELSQLSLVLSASTSSSTQLSLQLTSAAAGLAVLAVLAVLGRAVASGGASDLTLALASSTTLS